MLEEETLIPSLTVRENLSTPLTFKAIDKHVRDETIERLLSDRGLKEVLNKFPRYLSPEEHRKVSSLRKNVDEIYPEFEQFIEATRENEKVRACLPLIQHGLFTEMSDSLRHAIVAIKAKEYDGAVDMLESVLDWLALRITLASLYEVPSLRVLEVSLLVVRSYHDLFRYRTKVNETMLKEADRKVIPHLEALAESFSEIGRSPH